MEGHGVSAGRGVCHLLRPPPGLRPGGLAGPAVRRGAGRSPGGPPGGPRAGVPGDGGLHQQRGQAPGPGRGRRRPGGGGGAADRRPGPPGPLLCLPCGAGALSVGSPPPPVPSGGGVDPDGVDGGGGVQCGGAGVRRAAGDQVAQRRDPGRAEAAARRHVVVGVGINLTQTAADFGPEVAPVAVSLAQALGRAPRRAEMAAAVLAALDELYAAFPAERAAWLERYRADCLTLGRTVRLLRAGEEEEAFAEAVDDAFALVVRRADGSREAVSSGEVSVRGLLGYV